jgi:lipid II:glycine glycyltransferase (peptidoglycan interpeptide bridge formation enzyme)
MALEITTTINKEDWSAFVSENEYDNIFQTPEMAEVYSNTKRMEAITLFAVEEGEILASVVAYVSTEKGGLLKPFATRAVIPAGCIYQNTEKGLDAFLNLIREYDKTARKKAIFTEIRMMHDIPEYRKLEASGYGWRDHLNIIVDLNKPRDDVWKEIHKTRRYGIKKAREAGVTVEKVTDASKIPIVYSLLKETYKNVQMPLADVSLLESAYKILYPKKKIKILLAKHNDRYIGTVVLLVYNGRAYEWYAGALPDALSLCPNDLLVWTAIESACERECRTFDFGGAGSPDKPYGVREFKRKFGGDVVNLGRYKKVYHSKRQKIAHSGFEFYRKVFIR